MTNLFDKFILVPNFRRIFVRTNLLYFIFSFQSLRNGEKNIVGDRNTKKNLFDGGNSTVKTVVIIIFFTSREKRFVWFLVACIRLYTSRHYIGIKFELFAFAQLLYCNYPFARDWYCRVYITRLFFHFRLFLGGYCFMHSYYCFDICFACVSKEKNNQQQQSRQQQRWQQWQW